MIKQLANLAQLQQRGFTRCMENINKIARESGLQEYTTYSRIWEYPWLWLHLEPLKGRGARVLDIGSEKSPFPWFLRAQDFNVIVSDATPNYWHLWRRAESLLSIHVRKQILDAQDLDLPTASVDIYQSVSVIEHVPNKERVIAEAARVLVPGGWLILTFDICEPDMGMEFPEWNGRALSMREFDDLFRNTVWFEPGLYKLPWNTDSIPEYLTWHRTTAPHHNYVTGSAMIRRNDKQWREPIWQDYLRVLKGIYRTISSVGIWYLRHIPAAMSNIRKSLAKGSD